MKVQMHFPTVCWGVNDCEGRNNFFLLWCYICLLYPRPLSWGIGTNIAFLFRISFEGQEQNLQNIPSRFKNWYRVCRTNIDSVGNFFHLGFLQSPLYCALGSYLYKPKWPLKHAPHLQEAACMEVWKLIRAICTMVEGKPYFDSNCVEFCF